MFKHILIPTDGSPTAHNAVEAGIRFAGEIGAKVTVYSALEDPLMGVIDGEGYTFDQKLHDQITRTARESTQKRLG
jgi:nucleotide-binding universal stress UspA family protein